MSSSGPIDAFLEVFARRLAVTPARRSRILREVEDHLRDAAEAHMDNGSSTREAELQAIADFGAPVAAAERFGVDPIGRAYRLLLGLMRRRRKQTPAASSPGATGEGETPLRPLSCDICGKAISETELFEGALSAVGDIEAPVTVVLHRTCYEMGEALLAVRGMPVVLAPGGQPSSRG